MQAHDSNDQRPEESNSDGRRDTEPRTTQNSVGLALEAVLDLGNRTVCLSAGLSGKGGVSA